MAKTSLVVTILGPDRPGLVEALARTVAEHDANWLESRMAHLAGQFAGILRVEVDAAQADGLADALKSVGEGAAALEAIVHPDATPVATSDAVPLLLDLMGHDRPGIVREIARVLAANGVNVEELATETVVAANTGQPMFRATAKLRLPKGCSEDALRDALEAVAADLVVDISLGVQGT